MNYSRESIISHLTTDRQSLLNHMRWGQFLSMGIDIEGKTIFEPGAGIGDQTKWLLDQGAKHVHVSDGRSGNLDVIRERFGDDPRLTYVLCDIEKDLDALKFHVDFIFCYGVYYHARESFPQWHIMRGLAKLGDAIAIEYLEGEDEDYFYGYENPSTSISQYAFRPKTGTLMNGMKEAWGHSYYPKHQLKWVDPVAPETRFIAVASHKPLAGNLIEF